MKIYILAAKKAVVSRDEIYMRDVAKVFCTNKSMQREVENIKLGVFPPDKKKTEFLVLHLYEKMCIYLDEQNKKKKSEESETEVEFVEEHDVLVQYKAAEKKDKSQASERIKNIFVSLLCFFGAAFSIMAFQNDIGILRLFDHVYKLFAGTHNNGDLFLEIPYSIGLGFGIILFFNHVGRKKITDDPTPVEVAMNSYEESVNDTLMSAANSNLKTAEQKKQGGEM